MPTITETLSEIDKLKKENLLFKELLRVVKTPEMIQIKIDLKKEEISKLINLKGEIYLKPLFENEKAELSSMYQKWIEERQTEKSALEQLKAQFENLIVP